MGPLHAAALVAALGLRAHCNPPAREAAVAPPRRRRCAVWWLSRRDTPVRAGAMEADTMVRLHGSPSLHVPLRKKASRAPRKTSAWIKRRPAPTFRLPSVFLFLRGTEGGFGAIIGGFVVRRSGACPCGTSQVVAAAVSASERRAPAAGDARRVPPPPRHPRRASSPTKGDGSIWLASWRPGSSPFHPTRASCDELRFCHLVKRCHKPDRKEFTKVAARTGIGFIVMGFVGFFLKLIFIPINNIIVGSG